MDILEYIKQMQEMYGDDVITTADKINRPDPKPIVKEIEAINEFVKRNPRADGGRAAFRMGGFEKMNLNRRLKAYNELKETYGTEFVEKEFKKKHGTSFEKIAGRKEYKGRTVTNIIDTFKKQIKGVNRSKNTSPVYNKKTGHIYKTSNRFGVFYSTKPKTNQFTGKELTKNKKLIANITKDAPFMSQKELIEKYKINKKTLTKIRDQNNLTFRQSYKPTGTQKKEIPYVDRYTAQEKSDMYKKRKATETEEDRSNARERKKKYMDKTFKEYKMEPSSRKPYDDLWKDIARSSKEGDRIKLVEGPKYSSGASYDDFKNRVFLDTKTNETFNYNNLKQYLDSGKLEGVTYNSVIEPYDLKNQIAKSGLREEIQQAYFGDRYKPPSRFRSQNTFHVQHIGGVAADPFSVQLTFADQNLGLVHNKKFNTEWARLIKNNAPLSERKAYLKFVKKQIGDNIAQTLEFPEVGKTRTFGEIGTNLQKLLSSEKLKDLDKNTSKALLSFMKRNGVKCTLSNGINCGRPEAYVKSINELKAKAAAGDKKAAEQLIKVTKGLSKGGSLLRSLIGPGAILAEPVFEGVIVANKVLDGKPLNQAWAESYLSYLDPNRVDPKTLEREEMLYRQIEGPERKVRGGKGTVRDMINIDAPGASKLRPLFAAEDTMAAFEKAKKEKRKGKFISRKDIENRAAADIRDIRKTGSVNFAQQIINDPATQKALSDAQEYIAAKRGAASSIAQSAQADEARRKKAMKAEGVLTIEDAKNELKKIGKIFGQGYTPYGYNKLLEEAGIQNPGYGITKVGPVTGKYNQAQGLQDFLNSMRMQTIADAGGVANLASGGIANLTNTIPPESGPMSQGLRSLYNNGRKL